MEQGCPPGSGGTGSPMGAPQLPPWLCRGVPVLGHHIGFCGTLSIRHSCGDVCSAVAAPTPAGVREQGWDLLLPAGFLLVSPVCVLPCGWVVGDSGTVGQARCRGVPG